MQNETYIQAHELWQAFTAVSLGQAGLAELETLHAFDVDPLADDFETQVIDAINDQVASEHASFTHKISREAA